ncbi:glycosyltransferase family 2 protein [Leuconostoc falkenbergense]|uniref:glycosyltransferase family 2 protein n=1 Tax=Leuconostoc falkenbergense TaxID=2766470 RepID=UPI003F98EE71
MEVNRDKQSKSGKDSVLSIVVPVHNEQDTIQIFYNAIENILPDIDAIVHLHFVDDGSTDVTLQILRKLSDVDESVHYISFSRNFGKEAAIYAGLQQSDGDYVAVMDVDLQDPPELLPEMLREVQSECWDAVGTRRSDRYGEKKIRTWLSTLFYKWINRFTQTQLVDGARDFRVMTRQMVEAVLSLSENQRFSKGIFTWVGFRTKYISFQNRKRVAGKTSWSLWKLMKYAVEGMISFSTVPLVIVALLGFISFFIAVIAAIFIVLRALIDNKSAYGWPSMVTIMLFISSIQLLSLGVIGRYVAAVFLETKRRPIYITREEK